MEKITNKNTSFITIYIIFTTFWDKIHPFIPKWDATIPN